MRPHVRRLLKSRVFRNVLSLYAVQGCTYLLPLLTFPYLGRVLRPEGWGAVLFAQAIGSLIAVAVEYGFDFSAVREVARCSTDRLRLQGLVAGVLGAKATLAAGAVLIAVAIRPLTMHIAPSPALFWASVVWGVAQGVNMLWYFQGLQRMGWAGGLEITGKIVATISIFALVRSPQDGWKVMAAQALGCAISHGLTVGTAYREVGFRWPTPRLIAEALRMGAPMFLFKASQTLMGSANGVILGFCSTPTAVGLFGGADKIRQVGSKALWPATQALFPHQSQRVTDDPAQGVKVVRHSLLLIGALGLAFGITVLITAPLLVRVLLGPSFLPAVPALRIFALVIPVSACASVLCFQWMLPLGFDREFNKCMLTAGIINVTIAIAIVPKLGVTGMAIAIAVAESYALIAYDTALRRKNMSPLGRLKVLEPVPACSEEEESLVGV